MDKYATLNELLVRLFHDIMDIEQKSIAVGEFKDLTANEIHVIEAIEPQQNKRMSDIARTLEVTVGTLTIAMNGLVKKGYVVRKRSETDRRVVQISLTEKGEKLFQRHAEFHDHMITAILAEVEDDEQSCQILINVLKRLTDFFHSRTF